MAPRGQALPEALTDSAREARKAFFCELCQKGYARNDQFEAHEGSYDHQHKKRLKEMKQLTKDPNAANKAREAERKANEEAGMKSINLSLAGAKMSTTAGVTKKKPVFKSTLQPKTTVAKGENSVPIKPDTPMTGAAAAEQSERDEDDDRYVPIPDLCSCCGIERPCAIQAAEGVESFKASLRWAEESLEHPEQARRWRHLSASEIQAKKDRFMKGVNFQKEKLQTVDVHQVRKKIEARDRLMESIPVTADDETCRRMCAGHSDLFRISQAEQVVTEAFIAKEKADAVRAMWDRSEPWETWIKAYVKRTQAERKAKWKAEHPEWEREIEEEVARTAG